MAEPAKRPGDDQPITDGKSVIQYIRACRQEAEQARRTRLAKNRINRDAYEGRQDWSKKAMGQSAEFIPKTGSAIEQVVAVFNKALVSQSDWFSVRLGRVAQQIVRPETIVSILMQYLDRLPAEGDKERRFASVFSEGLKVALLESVMVFKVFGQSSPDRKFVAEQGGFTIDPETGQPAQTPARLVVEEGTRWRLRCDLLRVEDYYPDPWGRGLYEIHRCERDWYQVMQAAEAGLYDPEAVERIEGAMRQDRDPQRHGRRMNQDEPTSPTFRKPIVIDEFWGTILDDNGKIVHRNCVAAIANDSVLIRPPKPNPFWHQESPFVAGPLIRVPFSQWHKAVFDEAVQLNGALNELFNLMIDGGLASVWGTRQLRAGFLEDAGQVTGGIPQGTTLIVNENMPAGLKVLETVTDGEVPRDAMIMYELLNREFTAAALTNELKLGSLPPRQVKATEVVELSQSQAATLDSIAGDAENTIIAPLLRKAWLTILQHLDVVDIADLAEAVGDQIALALMRMSPPERFALLANDTAFTVDGLSSTLAKVKDFQKSMAFMQSVITNPLLLRPFILRFSDHKTLSHLMRLLNLNPASFEKDELEMANTPQQIEQMVMLSQSLGAGQRSATGGAGLEAAGTGGPELPAQINQIGNPLSGMAGA